MNPKVDFYFDENERWQKEIEKLRTIILDCGLTEEFQTKLDKSKALKKAFEALTPGRQRAYLFYFSQAKQSQTRAARVEKYIPKILEGKGLED